VVWENIELFFCVSPVPSPQGRFG